MIIEDKTKVDVHVPIKSITDNMSADGDYTFELSPDTSFSNNHFLWRAIRKSDQAEICLLSLGFEDGECVGHFEAGFVGKSDIDVDAIKSEFKLYLDSYEGYVTQGFIRTFSQLKTTEECVEAYEKLIAGCAMIRGRRNHVELSRIQKIVHNCLSWLRTTDFYVAPASTRYHDCCVSGLLLHSLTVALNALALYDGEAFHDANVDSILLVALAHDWCKINLYQPYMRNVKNERTGQWEGVQSFKRCDEIAVPLGHGEASAYMIERFFRLTLEERLAIRWHMGHWRVANDDINEFQYANENYPMVHLIQFADQLSITNYTGYIISIS